MIKALKVPLDNHKVTCDFYVASLLRDDVVIGPQWLNSLGEYVTNMSTMYMKIWNNMQQTCLIYIWKLR